MSWSYVVVKFGRRKARSHQAGGEARSRHQRSWLAKKKAGKFSSAKGSESLRVQLEVKGDDASFAEPEL